MMTFSTLSLFENFRCYDRLQKSMRFFDILKSEKKKNLHERKTQNNDNVDNVII